LWHPRVCTADAGSLLPQEGLKEYQQKALMSELGTEYGENTASPPKGRRAGRIELILPLRYAVGASCIVNWHDQWFKADAERTLLTMLRLPGVLLHPTSLPGSYGIGTIGSEAFRFVDWLVSAGMQVSLLPVLTPIVPAPCVCCTVPLHPREAL
jgi:hypothetical protein